MTRRLFYLPSRKSGRRAALKVIASIMGEAAERQERAALAEAERAFCAGRGEDGRRALDVADFARGSAAGYRHFLASA